MRYSEPGGIAAVAALGPTVRDLGLLGRRNDICPLRS
jgi:hypothetical protein